MNNSSTYNNYIESFYPGFNYFPWISGSIFNNGIASLPVNLGRTPSHLSAIRNLMSCGLFFKALASLAIASALALEATSISYASASAASLTSAAAASACVTLLIFSFLACRASCSALTFNSIALLNSSENSKSVIANSKKAC